MRSKKRLLWLSAVAILLGLGAWQWPSLFNRTLMAQAAGAECENHDGCDGCEQPKADHDEKPAGRGDEAGHAGDEHAKEGHDGCQQPKADHDEKPAEHSDEDGHTENEHAKEKHEGHGREKKGDERYEGKAVIRLTAEQRKAFGIAFSEAGPGRIDRQIRLPGELTTNSDRTAHIMPPVAGIVRKVMVKVGDRVKKGDALAVLESAELGEAKTEYLAKLNELSCCAVDLDRSRTLQKSAQELRALLDTRPTLDKLRAAAFTDLGEDHGKLISAYGELVFARAEHEREKKLIQENISSKADFQAATNAYKKAHAEYIVARGSLAFESQRTLSEAQRTRQNAELETKAAERKLRVLGLTESEVTLLQRVAGGGKPVPEDEADCEDGPDCKDCVAHTPAKAVAGDVLGEHLGLYSLRAPFDGTVIERHISLGEKLSDDADVFTVSDMSSVWVNLSVYQKDLPYLRHGQKVRIVAGEGVPATEGRISLVSPIVDRTTRTCLARVVLPNPKGHYRPGLFVTANVSVSSFNVRVLIPRDAVQQIEGKPVVFVSTDDGIAPAPVKTGRLSQTHVEIVSGLAPGRRYVVRGAFQLKAEIVTSGLGAHAGHGH